MDSPWPLLYSGHSPYSDRKTDNISQSVIHTGPFSLRYNRYHQFWSISNPQFYDYSAPFSYISFKSHCMIVTGNRTDFSSRYSLAMCPHKRRKATLSKH